MNSIKKIFYDFFGYKEEQQYDFILPETAEENSTKYSNNETQNNSNALSNMDTNIYSYLSVNLEYINTKYNTLINSDIVVREFTLNARGKQYSAFLLYIDGMVNSQIVNDFVLQPLMLKNRSNTFEGSQNKVISESVTNNITVRKIKKFNLVDYIFDCLIPQNNVTKADKFSDLISGVNSGNCALLVDTINIGFDIDVKGFKQRSIESPNNEVVIKGPQEAFVENLRTNTSLIRRIINNENLIIESIDVGKISKTKCAVCYIQNITNDDLVAEVKYRLNNLDIDSLLSSGQLEQLITESTKYNIPQILSTERPDKVTKHLFEGRVAVLINGNPYCLIMPATFIDFMASPEDTNINPVFANFLKLLRLISLFITCLLPGFSVAISNFHQELIPTELLFSILASRESVPFPIIFEIVIMEISFELIREAGLRVPSPVGPTIGIVGALVLRSSSCKC